MRLFSKDKDLGKDFKDKVSVDTESRADFIRRSRGLVAADLKALVRTMVSEKATYRRMRKRRKIVNYVDLYDLKKHFEGKPAQYETVYKAGPEFTCTHTQGLRCMPSILSKRMTPIFILRGLTSTCRIAVLRGIAHPPM